MSKIGYLSAALGLVFTANFSFVSASDYDSSEPTDITAEGDGNDPTIYSDVSDEAIDSAVADSFKGPKIALGVAFAKQKAQATTDNTATYTNHSLNVTAMTARVEYQKLLKNNLTVALEGTLDFAKKKKFTGTAKQVNEAVNLGAGTDALVNGKVETPFVVPSVAIKGGMAFPKYKMAGYAKVGMTRSSSKYVYYNNDNKEVVSLNAAKIIPFFCLGIEKKFTPKWGAALEFDVSLKKKASKTRTIPHAAGTDAVTQDHKIKQNRRNIRLMATYSLPSAE